MKDDRSIVNTVDALIQSLMEMGFTAAEGLAVFEIAADAVRITAPPEGLEVAAAIRSRITGAN